MTDIADLAKYRASLRTPAVEAGKMSPTTNVEKSNEEENASSVRSSGLDALMDFGKNIVGFLIDILPFSSSVLDELSPHIQRDIGLIDFSQSKRENTWSDLASANKHWLRRP
jgi:hypothetical protein